MYPKWKYNATLPPVIVADAAAETALGAGWYDAPVAGNEPDLTDPTYNPAPEV